jgi:hypothetical protein
VLTEDDPSDPHGLTPTATVRRARAYLEQDGGSRRRPVSDLYGMLMRIEILPLHLDYPQSTLRGFWTLCSVYKQEWS